MNYQQTFEYMYSRLPMFQRIGAAAYKANLNNTIALCNLINNPQNNFKTIHIAGTNGKGSTAHLIASVLQSSGLKVGLYTSPHLKNFRERIRINGDKIPEDYICSFIEKYKSGFEKIKPSFFEMTVVMAFDYFFDEKVDIAVIEVGMGGRLDSTNIIDPELSIITNIGFDHTQFLGESIEKIAKEKAAIIKPETPVVIGETQDAIKNIFLKKTKSENAPIIFADEHFELNKIETTDKTLNTFDVWKDNRLYIEKINIPLLGNYQTKNLITSLQALDLLKNDFNIDEQTIRYGIADVITNTGIIGRWQVLNHNPLTICDTAHNIDGIRCVLEQIKNTYFNKLHFVLGMVNDKNIDPILQLLPKETKYYFCKADIPRGLDQEILRDKAEIFGLKGEVYNSVRDAFNTATNNAGMKDMVFVGGSSFVVAEVI
jgi:dihydrofolate synthase/folylpolyglutamate synthase